jgi:glutathione synthase/RimK-type ligase-like ATP-grasp enzyme
MRHLAHDGYEFRIVDCWEGSSQGLDILIADNCHLCVGTEGPSSLEVSAVWWRVKPRPSSKPASAETLYYSFFSDREWSHIFEFVGQTYPHAFWVNRRNATKRASNKLFQLSAARSVGLRIPRTLFSNNPARIIAFAQSILPRKTIHKTMTAYMSPNGLLSHTTVIDQGLIEANAVGIKMCPAIYQELLNKKFELRITIVGTEIFAAKIDSQTDPEAMVDWRASSSEDMFSTFEMDQGLKKLLLDLHSVLDLCYGAYDLVIDQEDSPIFLEINPVGQWLWLEEKLNLPISRSIACVLGNAKVKKYQ